MNKTVFQMKIIVFDRRKKRKTSKNLKFKCRNLKKLKLHCIELKDGSPNQVTYIMGLFSLNFGTLSARIL